MEHANTKLRQQMPRRHPDQKPKPPHLTWFEWRTSSSDGKATHFISKVQFNHAMEKVCFSHLYLGSGIDPYLMTTVKGLIVDVLGNYIFSFILSFFFTIPDQI